jgi:hypothetical protein
MIGQMNPIMKIYILISVHMVRFTFFLRHAKSASLSFSQICRMYTYSKNAELLPFTLNDSINFFYKGKSERTREFVMDGLTNIQQTLLRQHNLIANIRLETYDGENYFHCPPSAKDK